jgi:hypothetical protein
MIVTLCILLTLAPTAWVAFCCWRDLREEDIRREARLARPFRFTSADTVRGEAAVNVPKATKITVDPNWPFST